MQPVSGLNGNPWHPGGVHRSLREQIELALDMLYRRKWLIVAGFVIVLAATVWYTYPIVPLYRANSYIMVQLSTMPVGSRQASPGDIGPGSTSLFAQTNRSVPEELLLLQISSPLALRVAERLLEMKVLPMGGKPIPVISGPSGRTRTPEYVAAILQRQVQFTPERGSLNVISVSAVSTSAAEAALLANLFAEEYEAMTREAGAERHESMRAFLDEQEHERREELRRIEAEINTYLTTEGGGGLDQSGSRIVTRIAGLQADRDEYLFDLKFRRDGLAELEAEIERLSSQFTSSFGSNLGQELEELRTKISDLEAHKSQVEERYPEANRPAYIVEELKQVSSDVEGYQAELSSKTQAYMEQLARTGGSPDGGLSYLATLRQKAEQEKQEIERIEGRIGLLEKQIGVHQQEYRRLPVQSLRLAELERSRAYAEQMYQYIAGRALEMRIAGESDGSMGYVRVLQQARIPGIPLPNDAGRNLILGAFFGMLFGLGLAVARDKLDNRIFKPEQLVEAGYLGAGVIPNIKTTLKKQYGKRELVEHEGNRVATSLVTLLEPATPVAESYRALGINVEYAVARHGRTLLVTSAGMGEGKSVSAANLAVTMARAGRRTLLIDCDLRRPEVHHLFGIKRDMGLIQMLRGEARFEEESLSAGLQNLSVLTTGGTALDSAELLGSAPMREVLRRAAAAFDVVVVDTPPVMVVTDALVLASQCDGVLFVARAGRTKEKELQHCINMLEKVGATNVATVLNGFDVGMAYGYKYRYQHYAHGGPYATRAYAGYWRDEKVA